MVAQIEAEKMAGSLSFHSLICWLRIEDIGVMIMIVQSENIVWF